MDLREILTKCTPDRKQKEIFVYFVLNKSGLGDQISRLSVFNYIKKEYPWVNGRAVVPDYFKPFMEHCLPDWKVITFAQAQQIKKKFGNEIAVTADKDHLTTMRMPLTWQAYAGLLDAIPMDPKNWNYVQCPKIEVSQFNLPEKYVVIPVMHTAPVREFPANVIKDISFWCTNNGYTPVFVGREEAPAHSGHVIRGYTKFDLRDIGIDLVNKTSIVELASIMWRASAVVGLDNGLLHLAGTTDVPIVFGFTSVDPLHRVPWRHDVQGWNCEVVNPPESLECRYCQSRMNHVYDHDFKFCFFGHYLCINQMKSEDYINALQKAIENDKRK
jgi:ADP-heptose:LPS heptosyltransferase